MITVDSYSEANITGYTYVNNNYRYHGQSFTGNGSILEKVTFKTYRTDIGTTGSIVAKIYSHDGTYGTTGIPKTLLATSDAVNVATIGAGIANAALKNFTFSGGEKITLQSGVYYVVIIDGNSVSSTKGIYLGNDTSGYTHPGCEISWNAGTWLPQNGDMAFYVYASAYLKILTDTTRASELKTSATVRTLLDPVIQTATMTRLIVKNATSNVVVTGVATRIVSKLFSESVRHAVLFYRSVVRIIASNTKLTEIFSGLATRFKTLSDTAIATGSVVRLITKLVSENTKIFRSIVRSIVRVPVNVVTTTESITKFNQHTKTLSDTSVVTGSITKLRTAYRTSIDFVTLSVQQIRRLNGVVTMWAKTPKATGSMTPVAKDTGSFTPAAKDAGTLTPVARDTGQNDWNKEMRDL